MVRSKLNGLATYDGQRTKEYKDGKVVNCPFYTRWSNLLQRCHSEVWHNKHPNYKGCTVCDEWLTFSNFKRWMETQDWEGKQLDKDLLGDGKLYSPETCCFLTQAQNKFLITKEGPDRLLPTGVTILPSGRYRSVTTDFLNKKRVHIGVFDTPQEASVAWKLKKAELAKVLFKGCEDRILKSVLDRYVV